MLEKKRSVAVQDADGNRVQHQMRVLRVSDDGMIDAVELSFQAHVPAMGYSGYCMVFSDREDVQDGMITHLDDNYVRIETDIYRIRLDLNKGGTFESLYYKTGRREMCKEGEYAFHEVRGYFRREGKTLSNKDSRATAEILENGPLKSVISLSSAIGGHKLTTTLTVFKASERIDVSLRADFKEDEFIGAPYDIVPEESESQRIRSHHNSFRNLHPVFPINAQEKVIYKNAAFDVFKSKNDNTKFDSWDQIKHNIVVNWLDAYDEKTDVGMAIFSDHTTSYGLSKEYPLHLTFAWGGDAGFWWGKCPLRGKQEMNYSIVVHQGDWENSGMCRRSEAFNTPIIVKQSLGRTIQQNRSFINIGDDQVDVSAVYMENDFLYIRLFNHSARSTHTSVSFDFPYASAAFTELDGRYIGDFSPEITFRPFGFVTIKATLALSTGREV